jgi:hypothetical protein
MRASWVLVGVALVATLGAGCANEPGPGGAGTTATIDILTPDQVVERALARFDELTSYRVRSVIPFSGGELESDLLVVGDDVHGTKRVVRQGTTEMTVEFLRVNGAVYAKGNEEFWPPYVSRDDTIQKFVDQWVLVDPRAERVTSYLPGSGQIPAPHGTLTREGPDTVNGVAVEIFEDTLGSTYAISRAELNVVRWVGGKAAPDHVGPPAVIDVSEIDSVSSPITPPAGKVLNYADFPGVVLD